MKTAAERKREQRLRDKADGLVILTLTRLTPEQAAKTRAYAAKLKRKKT